MKIVYWGSHAAFYVLETLKVLEQHLGEPIKYVLIDPENNIRKNQGWKSTKVTEKEVITLDRKGFWHQAIQTINEEQEAIHLFFSYWGDKRLFLILLYALMCKRKTIIMAEPFSISPHGYWQDEARLLSWGKVFARLIAYRLVWPILKIVSGCQLPCAMPLSLLAQEQLIANGFDKRVIFPTGYFIHKAWFERSKKEIRKEKKLRLVYSGALLKRKGLDIAIKALQEVNRTGVKVSLDVYGSGDYGKFAVQEIPGVRYRGCYSPEDAQMIISQYDALLVPSRHEGWGVVVNEALLQGVPVIVSSRVGAKCLIENSGAGLIFRSEDHKHLAEILKILVKDPDQLSVMQKKAWQISEKILPGMGAKFILNTILFYFFGKGERPLPAWQANNQGGL